MYELLILAQLSRRPMHGYMIAKIVNAITGPFRQVQWGSLYPVLSRLVRDGLIRVEEVEDADDGRGRKVYAVTEAGLGRLHELLMDTGHHLGEYAEVFSHKVAFFYRLTPAERLQLSRHYHVYAQQHIDHLERKCRDVCDGSTPLTDEQRADVLEVMNHRLDFWRRERDWAEDLINRNQLKEAI